MKLFGIGIMGSLSNGRSGARIETVPVLWRYYA